jgi:hypothetical protein
MIFQINGQGWPVGQFLIPAGQIVDTSANDAWANLEHFPAALNRRDSQPLSPRRMWGN